MNLSEVNRNQRAAITTYISRGVKISQSAHHKDMFILNYADGGFCNITSTADQMLVTHPPDNSEFKYRDSFTFNHTSSYKPTKMTVAQMNRRIMGQRAHGKN